VGRADFPAAASSPRNSYWFGIERDYGFPEAFADSERSQEGAIAKRRDRVYELGGGSRAGGLRSSHTTHYAQVNLLIFNQQDWSTEPNKKRGFF
jgi:hypothetical protein